MLKMVDGTGIIGVDMVCPLGGAVSPPQPPNYDNIEMEGVGSLMLPNSLKAPLERLELIGNSVQGENPAPDNPQEIKSAGRKSRNLFDAKKAKSGWISSDGKQTLATLGSTDNVVSDYIQVYPGMKYTSSVGVYKYFYDSEKIFLKQDASISSSIIIPDNAKYMIVIVPVNKHLAIQTANTLMINIGSSVLPYEQYTDKYLFDVKVTGKNLLNLQKEPDVKGTYQGWKVGDGKKTIILSIKDKGNNVDITKCSIGVSGNDINPNDGLGWIVQDGTILRSEIKTTNPYVTIYPPNETAVQKFLDRFEIQVEYGTTATPYEPYTEQSVQIALNEPLRGVGEYKDVLTKDGVVRRIKEVPLAKYLSPIEGDAGDRYVSAKVPNANINYDPGRCMSNIGFADFAEKKKYVPCPYQKDFLIRIADDDTIEVVTEKMKDVIVAYIMKEPVTEPLPESVQQQLQALHTENGITHVSVDSGEVLCGIKLTYRKEK